MPSEPPEVPWRVLAVAKVRGWKVIDKPLWWEWTGNCFVCWDIDSWESYGQDEGEGPKGVYPKQLTPIDHPRNDPEAIEIIRAAKKSPTE